MEPRRIVVVGGTNLPELKKALAEEQGVDFVRQPEPRGTADAARRALAKLPKSGGDVMILCGDAPLVRGRSLARALATHRKRRSAVTVVTAMADDPFGLGRIVRGPRGRLERIVEEKDATREERRIREVNSGGFVLGLETLRRLLPKIRRGNVQKEYYLTDMVEAFNLCAEHPNAP